MAAGKQYKRFAGHSVNNAGYHNDNWDKFFDGNSLHDVAYDSFAEAITYIGTSNSKTLYITKQHRISKNTTIPANISIIDLKEDAWNIDSGVTLTFLGSYSGIEAQHFTGLGYLNVVFATGFSPSMVWFGTDRTGVTDATAILQRFLDRGWNLWDDGGGLYKTTATLNLPNSLTQTSNIAVNISGKLRLRPTGAFDAIYHPYGVTTAGTDGSPSTVTMNTTARTGARTIGVTSASGMLVGDLIRIRSDTDWAWASGVKKGELNKITNISGTTLSLANPLFLNYNPTASGGTETVSILTFTPHTVHIDGLEIEYPAGTSAWGINLHSIDGSTSYLRDVTVKNATTGGIQLTESYGVQIENPTAIDCFVDGLGYGVGFNATTWCGVQGGYSYRCRHAVDYSGTIPCNGGLVSGMRAIGWTLASNPTGTSSANGGAGVFGTHVGANYIFFVGNTLSDGLTGFQIRSPNTFIHDNVYWDILSQFCSWSAIPGMSIKNNVNRWQTIAPVGGGPGPNIVDYFLDVDCSDADLDTITSGFVCEGNEATVATDFVFFRNGTAAIKQWSIRNNNVNIYGSGAVSFLNSGHSSPCTIDSSTVIDDNTVRVIAGTYQEWRNIVINSTAPAGFAHGTKKSIGPVHHLNGTAGSVTASTDADDYVLEGDASTGLSILAPNASATTIRLGSPSGNNHAIFRYEPTGTTLTFGALQAASIVKMFAANVEAIQLRSNLIQLLLNVDAFTHSGNYTYSQAEHLLKASTSDGSDNAVIKLLGGGAATASRGGVVAVYGNEGAVPGGIELIAGDVTGGVINFYTENALRYTIQKDGMHLFATSVLRPVQTGITASTTQTQGQQALTKDINIVSTCANANDVVTLPAAVAGMRVFIRNNGAQTLQIFPASGDAINAGAVDASATLAAGASVTYQTADATTWYS